MGKTYGQRCFRASGTSGLASGYVRYVAEKSCAESKMYRWNGQPRYWYYLYGNEVIGLREGYDKTLLAV